MHRSHLTIGLLAWMAACGGSDPAAPPQPDAPPAVPSPPDAGPVTSIDRIDWRDVRGEPLPTTTLDFAAGGLFALADDGFVLRTACDDPLGCTYTWYDDGGQVRRERPHLLPGTATTVSPDGRLVLLLDATAFGPCDQGQQRFLVADGTLRLLDLATGDSGLDLALRQNTWSAPAFTSDGRWLFAAPIADGKCIADRIGYRSATTPFADAPGVGLDFALAQVIDSHRWLVLTLSGTTVGVVDPDRAGSFVSLSDGGDDVEFAGGWVHAFAGAHTLAQQIVSLSPDNQVRRTPVEQDEDWFGTQSFGRWVRVCGFIQMPGFRKCRIIDVLGEHAPVNLRSIRAPDHPDDGVLLGAGAYVFVEPNGDQRAVKRADLATGRIDTLHDGDGQLTPLGDGAAALLYQNGDAWLIEAGHEELLAREVRFVLTTPRLPFMPTVRQHDVVLLAVPSGDAALGLVAFDVRTRRLAQLTDHLYLTPLLAPDDCGQPGATRHGGSGTDGLIQDGSQLFFAEPGDPASLFVLPIDLSAPPRRLATLSDPSLCHAPLTSPGGRSGFLEDDPDGGVRVTIANP